MGLVPLHRVHLPRRLSIVDGHFDLHTIKHKDMSSTHNCNRKQQGHTEDALVALAGSVPYCKSFRRRNLHVRWRPNDLNSADYGDDGCLHMCSSDSAELLFLTWPVLAPFGDSQAS